MRLRGTAREIEEAVARLCGGARPTVPSTKRKVLDYQMVALWALAKTFNQVGRKILEIGTGHGGSGAMLAQGAPKAMVLSLTVEPGGARNAEQLWKSLGLGNIRVTVASSWDYLARTQDMWDMIFVDGDHNQIARDLPWFNRLQVGGLLMCHDYSPADSPRPSPVVYERLNELAAGLGRPFDVEIIDDEKTGMVGFYRRPGERW